MKVELDKIREIVNQYGDLKLAKEKILLELDKLEMKDQPKPYYDGQAAEIVQKIVAFTWRHEDLFKDYFAESSQLSKVLLKLESLEEEEQSGWVQRKIVSKEELKKMCEVAYDQPKPKEVKGLLEDLEATRKSGKNADDMFYKAIVYILKHIKTEPWEVES